MNKESQTIADYIEGNPTYLKKIAELKVKYKNSKEFTNGLLYVIMDVVNTEKKFINIKRSSIDVPSLAAKFF